MPTYEYRCKACGRQLEILQSFTDDALTTCEACGGDLRKVFGSVGIAFKGSGFYKTDSRGKPAATPATAGANGDSKNDSRAGGDKAGGDKAGSDKSGSDKSGSDKGGDKAGSSSSSSSSGKDASSGSSTSKPGAAPKDGSGTSSSRSSRGS